MASENGKSGDNSQGRESPAPEVEAEIITDGMEQSAGIKDGFEEIGIEAESAGPHPPKKTTLTPGVILFVVFAAFAMLVFAIWRMQSGNEQSVQGVRDAAQPLAGEQEPLPQDVPESAEEDIIESVMPPAEESSHPEASAALDGAAKISNQAFDEIKKPESDIDPAINVDNADDTFLPPLPQTSEAPDANQDLQSAAKEATPQLNQQEPGAIEKLGDDIEENTGVPGAIADDQNEVATDDDAIEPTEASLPLEPELELGADNPSSVDEGPSAAAENENNSTDVAVADAAAPGESDVDTKKITNELAALKESFRLETAQLRAALDEERRQSAEQLDVIATMRSEFQAALDEKNTQENSEIAELRARLDKIQNDDGVSASRQAAGAIALSALQHTVDQGAPYSSELDVLSRLAPDVAAISTLRKYAEIGAPTVSSLKNEFAGAARLGLAAAGREKATGLFGNLAARAQSLISVRPAQPQAGDSIRAIISRAESKIENDELAPALYELQALPAPVQEVMSDWLSNARIQMEVSDSIRELNMLFLNKIPG